MNNTPAQLQVSLQGESPVRTASIHRNDRLFVPSVFFRKLGTSVGWISSSQSVSLKNGGNRLVLPSGKADVIHRPEGTYVPLRYTAESLGMTVGYNAKTGAVTIHSERSSVASASFSALASRSSVSAEDLYWLEQITEAEAEGEIFEGKVAVAAVILNRVDSLDWPSTIQEVIFQIVEVNGVDYYQFSPVLDKRIYEVTPSEETKLAVQAALNGEDPTGGAVVFFNPDKTDNQWVRNRPVSITIGNHIFAK